MEKNEFMVDLKTLRENWTGRVGHSMRPDGKAASDVIKVVDEEGPHRLYRFHDSRMHPTDKNADPDITQMPHFHYHSHETFFVDSGSIYLYIDGMRAKAVKGDIVHLRPGQAHGFYYFEETKWRGTFHDHELYTEFDDVARVKQYMPELANDPELNALNARGRMDSYAIEPFLFKDVAPEDCYGIKNVNRPHAAYEFPGVSMRVIIERWENSGIKELNCAVMEPGFTAKWIQYPTLKEVFYVRSGKVKFNIAGKEFIADDECVVIAPRYAPRSMEVLEKTEMYDTGGQSYWSLFLQSYESIKHHDPARLTKETVDALKKRFDIQIESIGMK